MVRQLSGSGNDTLSALTKSVGTNRENYGDVLLRFVIVNAKEERVLYMGRIDFLHKDTKISSETDEYDNVVLLKRSVNVDDGIRLIEQISRKETIDIPNFGQMSVDGGGFDGA